MALSAEEIKNRFPLPSYNYRVEINGTTIAFSQVSGLTKSFETTTYKESPIAGNQPGPVTMRMPGQSSDITVPLQKGVVRENSIKAFYDWIHSTKINQVEKRDITISLLSEDGSPTIIWTVVNAFPTSLEAPTFDANSNDVAVEQLSLMADDILMAEETGN